MRKSGFTMAEVLITLGILAVVIAMTMPSLIANYQKKVTVERLKKFYTVITNAARLSEAENGDMYTWNFPKRSYDPDMNEFFRKYYLPYLKDVRECNNPNCFNYENYSLKLLSGISANGMYLASYILKTNDGMYVYFLPNTPNGYIWMFVDINGHQNPNQVGHDVFVFDIYGYPNFRNPKNYKIKFWGINVLDEEKLYSQGDYACTKDKLRFAGFFCGEVIMRRGWEITDAYPW